MPRGHYKLPGYARWRRLLLQDFPTCELCNREASTQVHHPKPPKLGGAVMNRANALAVCYSCHRLETLRQKRTYGRI